MSIQTKIEIKEVVKPRVHVEYRRAQVRYIREKISRAHVENRRAQIWQYEKCTFTHDRVQVGLHFVGLLFSTYQYSPAVHDRPVLRHAGVTCVASFMTHTSVALFMTVPDLRPELPWG